MWVLKAVWDSCTHGRSGMETCRGRLLMAMVTATYHPWLVGAKHQLLQDSLCYSCQAIGSIHFLGVLSFCLFPLASWLKKSYLGKECTAITKPTHKSIRDFSLLYYIFRSLGLSASAHRRLCSCTMYIRLSFLCVCFRALLQKWKAPV